MYAQLDENKIFEGQTTENTGVPLPNQPFYQPKWTGTNWVEGMTKLKIDQIKSQSQAELDKQNVQQSLNQLTVTVDGFEFNANEKSQIRMLCAIQAAKKTGQTSTVWRLANNIEQQITLSQLETAQALAIQATGSLIIKQQNGAA